MESFQTHRKIFFLFLFFFFLESKKLDITIEWSKKHVDKEEKAEY